jgi:phosphohistidine phosphatase
MKTLLIIRHAKSSWDSAAMPDISRPLNDRGKKDAPDMARRLIGIGVLIDRFISSPARRAKETAEAFAHEFGRKSKDIEFVTELYHALPPVFKQVIAGLDDKNDTVALFAHNPGITAFANMLTSVRLDNMPTCSVFAVQSPADHWSEFLSSGPEFLFFHYPKEPAD